MIVELGHFALILATVIALYQTLVPAWGARVGNLNLMQSGTTAAVLQFTLMAAAFAALTIESFRRRRAGALRWRGRAIS